MKSGCTELRICLYHQTICVVFCVDLEFDDNICFCLAPQNPIKQQKLTKKCYFRTHTFCRKGVGASICFFCRRAGSVFCWGPERQFFWRRFSAPIASFVLFQLCSCRFIFVNVILHMGVCVVTDRFSSRRWRLILLVLNPETSFHFIISSFHQFII